MKIFLFVLTFFFVLGPVPNTKLQLLFDTIIIVSLVLSYYKLFIFKKKIKSEIKRNIFNFNLILFYSILISYPVAYFFFEQQPNNFTAIIKPIRIIITVYGSAGLLCLYLENYDEDFIKPLLLSIFYIMLINSVIIICQSLIPQVHDFISAFLYMQSSVIHFQSKYRPGGLFLGGGAIPSIITGLGQLLIPILLHKKYLNYIVAIVSYLVYTTAIAFTGRTGLILSVLTLIAIILTSKSKLKVINLIVVLALVMLLSQLYKHILVYATKSKSEILTFNIKRLLQFETEVTSSDKTIFEESTIKVLLEKWTIPSDILTILFGNIKFSNYYKVKVSDMGFNINLYRLGLIGSIIFYYPLLYMLWVVSRLSLNKNEKLFYLLFFMSYWIGELKESFMYSRNSFSILLLVFYMAVYSSKKNNNIKNILESK